MGRRSIIREASIADTVAALALSEASGGGSIFGTNVAFAVGCVVTANTSLTAFVGVAGGSTANTDGVSSTAGSLVLLTAQTTATQNGPYVVGTVTAGTAPLSRPSWWQTGSRQAGGTLISVAAGTIYKNTLWSAMLGSPTFTVGTSDPKFYPYEVSFITTLSAGVMTAGVGATGGAPSTMPVLSANSYLLMTRISPTGTASTIAYAMDGAPTPGPPGTGAISAMATIANGTLNNGDTSQLAFKLVNQL